LPPEAEEARARQAINATLEKYLRYWGPRYQVAPAEVKVEGAWAYGVARWQSEAKVLNGPPHVLAHRQPDGTWQALMPESDGLYLQWLDTMPESLVPAGEKGQLRTQAVEADALRQPQAMPAVPPPATSTLPTEKRPVGLGEPILRSEPTPIPTRSKGEHPSFVGYVEEGLWTWPSDQISIQQTLLSLDTNYAVADSFRFPVGGAGDHAGWDQTLDFDIDPGRGKHLGEDYDLSGGDSIGEPVFATANGQVKYAGYAGGYGGVVIIEHDLPEGDSWGDYVTSVTGHLFANTLQVSTGQEVQKGQLLGYVADQENNGDWSPHVHFGIRKGPHDLNTYYCSCCDPPKNYWVYLGYEKTCESHFWISNWWDPTNLVQAHSGNTCSAPSLSSPNPDYVSPGNTVTFVWTHPGNCTGQNGYLLRVGTSQGGSDVVSDYGVQGLQTNYTFDSQWYNRDLYWSVRANAAGAPWSEPPRHFRIEPSQGGGDTVVIYSEASFTGDRYGWHDPCTSPECGNLPDWLNTRASSIEIDPGWSVRVYEGDGQSGGQRCYNDSDNDFADDTFDNGHAVNDHVRSIAVYHQEQCPAPPTPPPAPGPTYPCAVTLPYNTQVDLQWNGSAGATEYEVERRPLGDTWQNLGTTAETHRWIGQMAPGDYEWHVRAHNQYGWSDWSSCLFAVAQGTPAAPSNLTATAISPSQINLTWSDNSSNETGFRIYRNSSQVASVGADQTTYQDTNLNCNTAYNYTVMAYNAAGASNASNTASATTQACPPSAPSAPNPTSPAQGTWFNCGDQITLVWDNRGQGVEYYAETWGANSRSSGWQTGNSWYLGEQNGTRTYWHVKARYVGQTTESDWGNTTWFNVNSCPQYPDLRPYTPAGYQYPVVPSTVQGTNNESTLFTDQPTYFDWHFVNDGNATAAGSFYVELWVDTTRYVRYPFSDFGTGGDGFDDWAETVSTPGWHTVRLVTDPDGSITESDENNNEWTHNFYWHVPCNDLNEYNDEPGYASWLNYGERATGVDTCPLGDWDYYTFYGEAGETIIADIDAAVLGSNLDSVLRLYDTDGTTVLTGNDDDGSSWDSHIVYTLSHDGYYYLRVHEYSDGQEAGGDYFYELSLAGARSVPYHNDFEGDTNGWETDGMWHLVDEYSPYYTAYSGTHSWWYGRDATGDYDNGVANNGNLTSPPIYIPNIGYYLRFNYWYQTETQGLGYDRRCAQVSVDNGPYNELYCLSDDGMERWHNSPAINLLDFAGHIIRIRFYFDTVDEYYNNFRGWYVDNFDISSTAPPSCSDGNEPNDSFATATAIAYSETRWGYVCPGADMDYFAFTGNAGDTIIADINAGVYGSWLDSVLFLLDSDGATELASNDDATSGSLDSLIGYTLPHDGTYYLKVRDYSHPSAGSADYYFELSLSVDNTAPTGAFLAPTSGTYISSTGHIPITVEASDVGSGIRNVTFLWHSGDWSNPDWGVLGEDWNSSDGWALDWDVGSLPDQSNAALYAWAFDWGGNWIGMECWGLTLDREPPTTVMETYAPYGGASFLDFWLNWSGNDATTGVASYDIQYRDGLGGVWTDLIVDTTDTYAHLVRENGHTYYFRSRARDWAGNAGDYPSTAQVSYTVQVCPIGGDEWEVDDTSAQASVIGADGAPHMHNFDIPGDPDWVKFDAVGGQQYVLETENTGGYADTVLYLYDTDGSTLLDFNDDAEGLGWASRIEWTAPADGTYYVLVRHWDEYAYGCETAYTLFLSTGYKVFLPLALRNR
jgi:murein DD-endopeptidase MepM/ murein hydrolase activator NlpD